jgi:hypothetical protein
VTRKWQEGLANCVVYSGTSPALETSLEERSTTFGADEETASETTTSETVSEAET